MTGETDPLALMVRGQPATPAELDSLEAQASVLIDAEPPMTIRQCGYTSVETGAWVRFSLCIPDEAEGSPDFSITLGDDYEEYENYQNQIMVLYHFDEQPPDIMFDEGLTDFVAVVAAADSLLHDSLMDARAIAGVSYLQTLALQLAHPEMTSKKRDKAAQAAGRELTRQAFESGLEFVQQEAGGVVLVRELNAHDDETGEELGMQTHQLVDDYMPDEDDLSEIPKLQITFDQPLALRSLCYTHDQDDDRTLEVMDMIGQIGEEETEDESVETTASVFAELMGIGSDEPISADVQYLTKRLRETIVEDDD